MCGQRARVRTTYNEKSSKSGDESCPPQAPEQTGHHGGRGRRIGLCTLKTYVRFFPCQTASLRENKGIAKEVSKAKEYPPQQPLHSTRPPLGVPASLLPNAM